MAEKSKRESTNKIVEFEIEFYERILEESPNFIECAQVLAELYTKSGKYKKGLELDKRLSRLLSKNPTIFYNLACSYALLRDIDSALESMKKAIELGFDDFKHMHSDPDLINLRQDSRFKDIETRCVDK